MELEDALDLVEKAARKEIKFPTQGELNRDTLIKVCLSLWEKCQSLRPASPSSISSQSTAKTLDGPPLVPSPGAPKATDNPLPGSSRTKPSSVPPEDDAPRFIDQVCESIKERLDTCTG